jgi:hypothetical protein
MESGEMRLMLGIAALGAALALGAAAAPAGGPPVALGVGTPVPQYFPPPSTIPAPIAPPPSAPGTPAPAQSVAPLPPLVLYQTPAVVVPVVPQRRSK